ncbi:AEC family transporter [Kushneria phosphatilytica]|uniref:AEC family transporter n=1 Tax=Kushneria phosphatilytica TaxID=657387 RepID=UPI0026CA021C
MGLALAASLYGDFGLSAGSLMIAVIIPLYNVLSVIVLATYQPGGRTDWASIALKIVKNPLILGVVAGLLFAVSGLHLPEWLHTSGQYFANLTLPLALISIGGTMSVTAIRNASRTAMGASLIKMVWLPLAGVLLALPFDFDGRQLALIMLYLGSPSAATSFVMARAMGGNAELAANIIAITTLGTGLTITLGIFAMQLSGLI